MAYTTINKSTDFFSPTLYLGNGSSKTVVGIPFEPAMTWLKNRSVAGDNELYDKLRGAGYRIYSNANSANDNIGSQGLSAWTSDGFTVGNNTAINGNGNNLVSWNWKGGTTATNTDGSTTTSVSANPTSGFSIVSYTGTGSVATLGHGLSTAPSYVIIKRLNVGDWIVGSNSMTSWNYVVSLNAESVEANQVNQFNGTAPTTSVVTLGTEGQTNLSGQAFIMYCFSDITGFSKTGLYTGNGSADGPFTYTGFKPGFILIRRINAGASWRLYDNKRIGYNSSNYYLTPNTTGVDGTGSTLAMNILSNGFKVIGNDIDVNTDGGSYMYMAFAAAPLVGSNNVPANAR
tara:strand:+ start:812 stop:1846 length:1035 start_codon:yes stop_codon:yes gene_type:complete